MGKPLSVFDKLGLGSKYREGAAFRYTVRVKKKKKRKKKKRNVTGNIQITVTVVIAILNLAEKKRGLYKQTSLNFSRLLESQNSFWDLWRLFKYQANCKQYRNYYECEYCPLKSKDSAPPPQLFFRSQRIVCKNLMSTSRKQSLSSKQMSVIYRETI